MAYIAPTATQRYHYNVSYIGFIVMWFLPIMIGSVYSYFIEPEKSCPGHLLGFNMTMNTIIFVFVTSLFIITHRMDLPDGSFKMFWNVVITETYTQVVWWLFFGLSTSLFLVVYPVSFFIGYSHFHFDCFGPVTHWYSIIWALIPIFFDVVIVGRYAQKGLARVCKSRQPQYVMV